MPHRPAVSVQSPNGDGVAEEQLLGYKIVRPSSVTLTLTAPDGAIAFQEIAQREAGTYEVPFPPIPPAPVAPPEGVPPPLPAEPLPPAEGRWTFAISAVDDQGLASSTTRRFWVNSTLGFLKVQPRLLFVPPAGRRATVTWTQTRAAQVTVSVETLSGIPVRTIVKRRFEPGAAAVSWDGRQPNGRRVFGGLYRIRVSARNEVGSVSLDQQLRVRRVAGPKK